MGIFNEFFKKEKPVFTGLKFGFGSGGGGAAGPLGALSISGGTVDSSFSRSFLDGIFIFSLVIVIYVLSLVVEARYNKHYMLLIVGAGGAGG